MENLINATLDICREADQYHGTRNRNSIFNHMMSEIGELGIEINIVEGQSYKKPGADGTVGESIDVILSAIDLIYVGNPSVQARDIYVRSYLETEDESENRNSLFCDLCGRAGIVGSRINQLTWAFNSESLLGRDINTVVYRAYEIIKLERPDITDDELLAIAQPKLDKWIQSIRKQAGK